MMSSSARLEAAHVVLIPLQFTDSNDLHQAVRESLTELKEQFVWAEDPYTLRHAQAMVQESIAAQREGGAITFAIRTKTGRLLGALTLKEVKDHLGRKVPMHQVEAWIRTSDLGQGHRVEALQAVAEHVLKNLNSRRVFGIVDAGDQALLNSFKQAGFQLEATLQNSKANTDGSVGATAIMAKLA